MATFIPLYFLGFSLNLLTMFALILVIGSLVDDAIVVAENVTRIMDEEGLSAKEATIKSMQEITGAIIATTLVILAIYAPIGFYGGMVGKIYVQFSVTMCIALMFSTLNALTLSPALCALLFKKKTASKFNLFKPFDIVLNGSRSVYLFGAKMMVRSSILTVIVFAAVCAGCYFMNQKTFTSFIPDEDKGACFCTVELDPGASIERTKNVVLEIQKRVKSIPGVSETVGICGFSMLGGQGENLGFIMVKFDDWENRKTQDKSIEAIKSKA